MTIAEKIEKIRDDVRRISAPSQKVAIVAAAKGNPAERVREAVAAGIDAVGENRVQEMLEKLSAGAYEGVPLHFIGHLQRNKVKSVVGTASLIHSVGSDGLLRLISDHAVRLGIVQDVLLEVNIGQEASKTGCRPQDVDRTVGLAASLAGVRVMGLMAIPPKSDGVDSTRYYFSAMYKLFVDISCKRYDNVNMAFLSMGMSGDHLAAVSEGANLIRIGSSIFGPRV